MGSVKLIHVEAATEKILVMRLARNAQICRCSITSAAHEQL
jgi:hypothetical protein